MAAGFSISVCSKRGWAAASRRRDPNWQLTTNEYSRLKHSASYKAKADITESVCDQLNKALEQGRSIAMLRQNIGNENKAIEIRCYVVLRLATEHYVRMHDKIRGAWRRGGRPRSKDRGPIFDSLSGLRYSRPFHFDA